MGTKDSRSPTVGPDDRRLAFAWSDLAALKDRCDCHHCGERPVHMVHAWLSVGLDIDHRAVHGRDLDRDTRRVNRNGTPSRPLLALRAGPQPR